MISKANKIIISETSGYTFYKQLLVQINVLYPASLKRPYPISVRKKLQKLNERPLQNLLLFECIGWLFESCLVLFGVILKVF